MTFRSYPNYDFRFGESLGESSWSADTDYHDKVVLTFTPPTSADYIVIATAEVQGDCISPPDVKARLIIGGSTYQELIYRIKDTTDWYPFCALKRINLPASSQTLKIQYAISSTTLTAKIRNARLYAFSLSNQYAESEGESTSTSTTWQDKLALTFTPSTSGDYLILATANYGGSSTDYSTLLQFLKDGSVQAGPTRETSATEARYTFGVMRKINLDTTSHTFKIQYRTENTANTARIEFAHIVAIRVDQFSNNYYTESEGESAPAAANTVYDKVTNTYTAQAADHLIIGSISYKAGSTSYSVGVKLLQGGAVDQSLLVEHKDSTDYESCFMMAKASLSAGSVTDKIQYYGESTSARVKNARLISLQLPIQTVEVEFTGSSNTFDWTQIAWTVNSAWTTSSVPVTLQLYNYNLGQYPTSGDGYISYASSATSNTDETKSQTITTNPTNFRDSSGNWKIKVKGIKSAATQFDFKGDLIKFEVTYTPPVVQYYLTVKTDPNGIASISGEGWYNNCTYVSLTAPSFVPNETGVGGERYRFANWTVDGNFMSGNPITVYMTANHTAVAHYVKQYKLIMSPNFGTTSPSVGSYWYDVGSVVSIQAFAPSVVDGEQYVWLGWTGTGTISYTGTANPSSVTMNSPITETASWRHEYRLTMVTNYGTTSPSVGDNWYEAGTPVNIQAFAPSVITGEQYAWNGWTGTGTISFTGMVNPSSVTMNSPISETASWTHQFLLTIKTSGLLSAYPTNVYLAGSQVGTASDASSYTKWFDAGTLTGTIGVDNTISGATGTRYIFVKWVEDSSASNPRASETMDSPKTFTANYNTQYQITVTANPGDAIGGQFKVTYTQSGTAYSNVVKATSWTEWVDGSTTVTVSEPQNTIDVSLGTRLKFDHYDPSASVTMDQAKTITLVYKTQYLVSFTQTGSAIAPTVTYTADTDPTQTVPFDVWVKAGSQITYTYQDTVPGASGVRYVLTGVSPSSPQTVNGPLTVSGTYQTQYYLTVNTNPPEVLTLNPAAVSGQGWYNSGVTVTVDAVQNVDKVAGTSRYDFRSWTGATLTGVGNQATVLMDGPKTATANYKLQYKITFSQSGVGSDFTSTVVVIDTTNYDRNSVSFWWDDGSSHDFAFQSPLVVAPDAKRYVWTSTTGLSIQQSGSIMVSGSGSVTGNYKTQYYLTVSSTYGSPTPASGWFDASSSITASVTSPWSGSTGIRYVCSGWTGTGSAPASGSGTSVSFSITQASGITWNWVTQYYLTVRTDPSGLVTIPGEGWYNASKSVSLSAPSVSGYTFLNWDVDGTGKGSGVSGITVTMNAPHTATAHYETTVPPPSVSIDPTSCTIEVNQSITFTSSVTGGTSPYTYQWYLDGSPISGATSSSWVFTPSASGVHYVYLKVTDSLGLTGQSETARVVVISTPVGGYSISLAKQAPKSQISVYTMLIILFSAVLVFIKRKRK
jgi:hypothetical protein